MKNKKHWPKHTTFEEWEADLMKNPDYQRTSDELEPQFQIARQMIGARIKQNMTQNELARKAKTGQAVISRLEGMNAKPSISLLSRIATALGTEIKITIKPA
jgi:ribosome-binding protein aMBF1 (putative translation factor)